MKMILKNKPIFIAISVFIIVLILSYFIINLNNKDFNNIKIDKTKNIVYTLEKDNDNYYHEIPYINIEDDTIKLVNDDIKKFYNSFSKDSAEYSYEYSISGDFLSIVLVVYNHDEGLIKPAFRSYTIDLTTLKIQSNEEIFKLFNITEIDVSNKIETILKEYYNELLKQGYFVKEECDYKCFLENRNISNYLDNNKYYIREGNLIAFKPYIFESYYGEEEFFNTAKYYEFEIEKNRK